MQSPVTILGIVGGIASGKSTVARLLAERGARVVDADAIAHEALKDDGIRRRLAERFGPGIVGADGDIDRKALAARVFGKPAELRALEDVVHPWVETRIRAAVDAHRSARAPGEILVLDVSLLATSPLRDACDAIVYVSADEATRRARCVARGWSADEIDRREAHQAGLDEKRALARWTIDNSGSIEETRARVDTLLETLAAANRRDRPRARERKRRK